MSGEFDSGPLSWVKGEIDQALQRAGTALAAGAAGDLRFCRTHVHQVVGALDIVGLSGATQFAESIERTLAHFAEAATAAPAEVVGGLRAAFGELQDYLDGLLAGAPHQPLRLLPTYRALAAWRGEAAVHPGDLFFPDLTRAPRSTDAAAPAAADPAALKAARLGFQKGLLAWLKQPAAAAAGRQQMHAALAAIEAQETTPAARAFWGAAQAFVAALGDPQVAADPAARQLCSRLDAQIRRRLEGGVPVAERLWREALYHVAQAAAVPELAALRAAYGLDALLPAPAAAPSAPPVLRAWRDALAAAAEQWLRIGLGSAGEPAAFLPAARQLGELAGQLGDTEIRRLSQGLLGLAGWLAETGVRFDEAAWVDLASALRLLQAAAADYPRRPDGLPARVDALVERLYARPAGRLPGPPGEPLADLAQRVLEQLRLGQTARDVRNHLAVVEQTLDGFFRDPAAVGELGRLGEPLRQVAGAFARLGQFAAAHSVEGCAATLRRFAAGEPAAAADCETLANELSLLGFFTDALGRGEQPDFAAFRDGLRGRPEHAAASSLESQLDAQVAAVHDDLASLAARPDAAQRDALAERLEDLERDAELVADARLGDAARSARQALNDGAPAAAVAAALAPGAPEAAPAPSAATLALASAGSIVINAELLEIFLEEAREMQAAIARGRAGLAADPADGAALLAIRRAVHTLKGSGRMVGLNGLGETAWGLEQTCNLWLQQERPASPALQALLADAQALFAQWLEHLAGQPVAAPDPAALIARAAALRADPEAPAASPLPVGEGDDRQLQAAAAALADLLGGDDIPELLDEVAPDAPAAAPAAGALPPAPDSESAAPAPTLLDIFRAEAAQHLASLRGGLAELQAAPTRPAGFPMLRAAHTLGGIAGTVGLPAVRELARGVEAALERRAACPTPACASGLESLADAIAVLQAMVDGLADEPAPAGEPELLARLAASFPAAPASEPPELPAPPEATAAAEAAHAAPGAGGDPAAPLAGPDDELDAQLLPIFLAEAEDELRGMAQQLRAWRDEPAAAAAPQALARLLHTFKGGARMAGAMRLGEATHELESRVDAARHGAAPDGEFFDELDAAIDALVQAVGRLGGATATPAPAAEAAPEPAPEEAAATLRVRADLVDRLVNEAGELAIARSRIEGEMRGLRDGLAELGDSVGRLRQQLREIEIQAESSIQAHLPRAGEAADFDPLELDRYTRLQELTRFLAESVDDVATVQHNLGQGLEAAGGALLAQARLNRSLQQELMAARMLPFASQAERLYRVVRQAAKAVGKRASLDIVGADTDLDRSVLDRMLAPLEHMLRNAVTHGIETAAERYAAGKPETGEITLTLSREGNEIQLALADDGGGLDPERLRRRGEQLGLLEPGQAMAPAALNELIFRPGFTTADTVSELAGRGVGMDVVRAEVTALGGRIAIESQPGHGTCFRIGLPLTLALAQTLLVRSGEQVYAIASPMIEQVQEVRAATLADWQAAGRADWQGDAWPLHFLGHLLGDSAARPETHRLGWVLFLRAGSQRIALQVDEVVGRQEVVVKNVGAQLARVAGIDGATVLGDGRIVLIINPVALLGRAPAPAVSAAPVAAPPPGLLVVDDSLTVRKITGRLLGRAGYRVRLAKDGVEALEAVADELPDLILTDIEMPRLDGFELLRALQADARWRAIPVIVITSRTADKHRAHALANGARHYLGKPYVEAELLAAVADCLRPAV